MGCSVPASELIHGSTVWQSPSLLVASCLPPCGNNELANGPQDWLVNRWPLVWFCFLFHIYAPFPPSQSPFNWEQQRPEQQTRE